jgi:hypothetical protein
VPGESAVIDVYRDKGAVFVAALEDEATWRERD